MVLLCDYGFRADQHAAVFVLVSFLYRVIRILSLDRARPVRDEKDSDEVLQRQTENRLVWACYFIDQITSSGIDKNSCWRDHLPYLPLLGSEARPQMYPMPMYIHQAEGDNLQYALQTLDLSALFILITRIRTRVLRYVQS